MIIISFFIPSIKASTNFHSDREVSCQVENITGFRIYLIGFPQKLDIVSVN